MKNITNYHYSSIAELSELIRQKKVSPVELVTKCLERIEELNPKLNAFITVITEQALVEANIAEKEVKNGNWRGPLHGIPFGIKDFYDTAGIKTTAAFEHFKDRVPEKDAVSVAKLKKAGAIIIGKTNMHTLGMGTTGLESYFGSVKNPWNVGYIPGGSSGGSAVAVGTGMCVATLDTDAVGSCRLPAAVCGVVGFKGSYSLIDTRGILEGTQPPDEMIVWLSHAGITTRSAEDTMYVLEALTDYKQNSDHKLKVGVAQNLTAHKKVLEVFSRVTEEVSKLGHSMSKVDVPFWDFSAGIGNIKADRAIITEKAFHNIDVLILPTIPTPTPTVKQVGKNPQALSAEYTVFANYYGLPAISVPCGLDDNGLPLGLQIVGKPGNESAVLQLAHQYESATGYVRKRPIE